MNFRTTGLAAVLAVFCIGLTAQTTSRLSGTVTDPSGAAVPAATVQVLLPGATAPVATTQTNEEGSFNFVGLNPGIFDLSVESSGFGTQVLRGLRI